MTATRQEDAKNTIKELAEAASTQSKFSNWLWLALVFISLVVLIPRPDGQPGTTLIELPFGLGQVEPQVFHFVALFMLSVVLVAFCQAHAQEVRARYLAYRVLDQMTPGSGVIEGIHPQDLFDALVTPSLSRVAPLAQLARGKYQFYPESPNCPTYLRVLTTALYAFLKVLATIAYLLLPGAALLLTLWRFLEDPPAAPSFPSWLRWFGFLYAAGGILSLIVVLLADVKYIVTVIKKIGAARIETR